MSGQAALTIRNNLRGSGPEKPHDNLSLESERFTQIGAMTLAMNDEVTRNEVGTVNGATLQVGTIHGNVTVHLPPEVSTEDPGADPIVTDVRLRNLDYVAFADGGLVEEVPASGHSVQLLVIGACQIPVVLAELRVEVLSRHARAGELLRHAAALPRRRFEVLLDAVPPRLRSLEQTDFPYTVGLHECEALELKVVTEHDDVEWVLWLDWLCGSRSATTRIDLGGRPFRTAGRYARAIGQVTRP